MVGHVVFGHCVYGHMVIIPILYFLYLLIYLIDWSCAIESFNKFFNR